jgi:hypothetical protein
VAKPITAKQRERIERMLAAGAKDEARKLLAEWVHQHELTPWAMECLGRMHLARGERVRAGRLFFWAGVRDGDDVQAAIDAFLRRPMGQLLRTLWQNARVPFDSLPANVQADLRAFGFDPTVTPSVLRRAPAWWRVLRMLGRALVVAIFVTGVVTCLSALGRLWSGH